jgi:cytoskeletal protein RodZ
MNEVNIIEEKFTRCPKCRSFSVKKAETNKMEKLKEHFVPVTVQFCNNCSYRFTEYGKFSITYKKNWLVVVVPLVIVSILVSLFFLLSRGDNKLTRPIVSPRADISENKPVDSTEEISIEEKTGETPEIKTETVTEEITEEKTEEQTGEKTEENASPDRTETNTETTTEAAGEKQEILIENEIIIGNSNRFGVNWTPVENGVQITRLSNGPLKDAGFKVGDRFFEIDGNRVTTGNALLKIRDEIFRGVRDEAIVKVYRGDKLLYFKLIKESKKETGSAAPSTSTAYVDEESDTESIDESSPSIPGTQSSPPLKVFDASSIKVRASAPDQNDPSHRWCYLRNKVSVRRTPEQRVYVAGDPTGTKKWGVDDELIINRKVFEGLSSEYEKQSGTLPESSKWPPLDITDLVPPDRQISLNIELVDYGITWSNTEIYVVVK